MAKEGKKGGFGISNPSQIPDFLEKSGISLPTYLKSAVNRIVNNCDTLSRELFQLELRSQTL